ncbi:hypothetical protein, partial [Arthrobacter sp. PsM3]|uniref:hypothetical protein n=1 Tax=Arthrobacter sp. PsM3 TaxID=3030531 RepID=UPI00263B0934
MPRPAKALSTPEYRRACVIARREEICAADAADWSGSTPRRLSCAAPTILRRAMGSAPGKGAVDAGIPARVRH